MSADQNDDQAPEGTDQDQTPPEVDNGQDNDQHGRESRQDRRDRQARQRAAELEQERDALAARVQTLQRAEVLRIAGDVLEQAADLFEVGGVTLADVIGEDGEVDPGAVAAALDQLLETRPGLMRGATRPRGYANWGHTFKTDVGFEGEGETSWSDAFGAAGRGNGMRYT